MKNKFIKGVALVAMTSFVLFSCSTDNDAQSTTSSSKNDSSLFMRGSGQVYSGFEDLMTDLYSDNETVEETVEYQADSETYLVSEVTVGNVLQGYFVENAVTKEVVYLSEDATSGTVSQWSLDVKGDIVKEVFDLTQDPNYAIYGFSPETPTATGKEWWGVVYTPTDTLYDDGNGGCYRDMQKKKYRFGICWSTTIEAGIQVPAACNGSQVPHP